MWARLLSLTFGDKTASPIAERVRGGWSITGTLDWVTSWDIADVMLLMVRGAGDYADSIICMYLAAGRDPAISRGSTFMSRWSF